MEDCFLACLETLSTPLPWRTAFDRIVQTARSQLIMDHVVVYVAGTHGEEAVFARALGRARAAEADVDWGSDIAHQILHGNQRLVLQEDQSTSDTNREKHPFFLGLAADAAQPPQTALVLVRFGGPPFQKADITRGRILAAFLNILRTQAEKQQRLQNLEALERQMRLQEDFVSTISHELRTPLGFIKGYTTSLLRNDAQWDENTRREFLQIIDEEVDRLADLLEKMLESARLQSNTLEMNFQWMRLDALIRDVTVREMTRDHQLEVTLALTATSPIRGDSVRLSQVLENLFSNARKYAPGAPVTIRSWQDERWVYLEFSDQGPGIAPEHQPFIFERFYRAPQTTHAKGTGLGLFICREIIQAHNGKIQVHSSLGEGTTFLIQLPRATLPPAQEEKIA